MEMPAHLRPAPSPTDMGCPWAEETFEFPKLVMQPFSGRWHFGISEGFCMMFTVTPVALKASGPPNYVTETARGHNQEVL